MQPELLEDHLRAHPEGTSLEVIARDLFKLTGPSAIIERIAASALAQTQGVIQGADGLYRWDVGVSVAAATREADRQWLERARKARAAEAKAEAQAAAAAAEMARNVPVIDATTGEVIATEDETAPAVPVSASDASAGPPDARLATGIAPEPDTPAAPEPGASDPVEAARAAARRAALAAEEAALAAAERVRARVMEPGRPAPLGVPSVRPDDPSALEREDPESDAAEAAFLERLLAAAPEDDPGGVGSEPDEEAALEAEDADRVVVLVAKATDRHPSTGVLVEVGAVEIADGQVTPRRLATALRPERALPEPLLARLGLDAAALEAGADLDDTLAALAPMLDGARIVCLGSDRGAAFLALALRDAGLEVTFDGDVVLLWPVLREAGLVGARVDLEDAAGALGVTLPDVLDTGGLVDFLAELVLAAVDRGVRVARLAPRPPFDFSGLAFDRARLAALPDAPGIYRFLDRAGQVLYIGKAKRLRERVASYFGHRAQRRKRYAAMIAALHDLRIEETGTELEALLAEVEAIRDERPPFNVQLAVGARDTDALAAQCVLVLPGEGAETERVALVFVGGGQLIGHIHARRDGEDAGRVREALRRAFFIDRPPAQDPSESALVASWVARNRDQHSAVDIGASTSLDDACRMVEACVADPDLGTERVVHR